MCSTKSVQMFVDRTGNISQETCGGDSGYLKSKLGSLNFTSKNRSSKKATIKCTLSLNVLFIKNALQLSLCPAFGAKPISLTAGGEACHWLSSPVYGSPCCNLHTWTGQHKKPEELQFLVGNIFHHLRSTLWLAGKKVSELFPELILQIHPLEKTWPWI